VATQAFEPKEGVEGLVIETSLPRIATVDDEGKEVFNRKEGETFVVGAGEQEWPYATDDPFEQEFLAAHPQVKKVAGAEEIAAEQAEAERVAAEQEAQAQALAGEHNATVEAARLAVANDVDLAAIDGRGTGGRILVEDVAAELEGDDNGGGQ
jgi:pyruvate/2-oxoglutarate dehydrogenase complex dihydrolipoamide acyltransferase (E2) component